MNRLNSYGVAAALFLWVVYAVAENLQAPSPDLSLTVYAKPQRLVELWDGRKIHLFASAKVADSYFDGWSG